MENNQKAAEEAKASHTAGGRKKRTSLPSAKAWRIKVELTSMTGAEVRCTREGKDPSSTE